MSDEPAPASFLDRVNALSAPAVVGLGAAAGLLFAVLSALQVDSSPAQDLEHVAARSKGAQNTSAAPEGDAAVSGASGSADGGRQAEPEVAAEAPPQPKGDPTADAPVPEDESTDVVMLEPDVGAPADPEPETHPEPVAQDSAAPPSPPPSPAGRTQADRDAEARMNADELLAAAAEAYQDKRYKDAYRLATRSQRSRPRDKAQMLRGRSACRLRDQKNAREIVRSFKLGDEHRKTLRIFCKDRGVRVGL